MDAVPEIAFDTAEVTKKMKSDTGGAGSDFSKTNVQVAGVDESDIVKTDGKFHYYYNQ